MLKERVSMLFLEYGIRTHIPVGSIACLLLQPGTRVSHAAIVLAARVGTLLIWVGEAAVRLYAVGQPGGARADRLLYQAKLALDDDARLKVVRKMYSIRFGEPAPLKRSIEQLRGIEGARVRALYQMLARKYGVEWGGRDYDPDNWEGGNVSNKCLSSATACLYGLCEAAILAAGYAPAIGFVHTGKPQSFVYDVADIFKFETVVPVAFKVAAKKPQEPDREVRLACRDMFRQTNLLERIIPTIEEVLEAGEIAPPAPHEEAVPVAIPNKEGVGDAGHRS
jgi:CRISPR-associated protein Cas1